MCGPKSDGGDFISQHQWHGTILFSTQKIFTSKRSSDNNHPKIRHLILFNLDLSLGGVHWEILETTEFLETVICVSRTVGFCILGKRESPWGNWPIKEEESAWWIWLWKKSSFASDKWKGLWSGRAATVRIWHPLPRSGTLDSGNENISHCFTQLPFIQAITIWTSWKPVLPNRCCLFRGGPLGYRGPVLPIGLHLHSLSHKTVSLQSEHPRD